LLNSKLKKMKKVLFVLAIVMTYGLSISTASEKAIVDEKEKVVVVVEADENKTAKAEAVKEEAPKASKSEGCSEAKAETKADGCGAAKAEAKSEGCGTAKAEAKTEGCADKSKSASACGGK
jgi:hypothetical protein